MIGNESIPQATKSKHLGMQVDNALRWNAHIIFFYWPTSQKTVF